MTDATRYVNFTYRINPSYDIYSRYQKLGSKFTIRSSATQSYTIPVNNAINDIAPRIQKTASVSINGYVTWDIMAPADFPVRNDDVYYTVASHESSRPDKVSRRFYGDWRLYWVIMQANVIFDPLQEIVSGTIVRVPSISHIMEKLTSGRG